jgi:uncharacterized membrane protein YcjF (UPF0283 family)
MAVHAVSGSLLLAAGIVDLWLEAWSAGGFQRSAAALVVFAGVAVIVRGLIAMQPRLRARQSSSRRDARSAR